MNTTTHDHDDTLTEQHTPDTTRELTTVTPPVDIFENANGYLLVADMPGLNTDDIEIDLERERLHLRAVSRVDGLEPVRYERSFRVVRGLDPDAITAAYADGILSVTLPRPASHTPRRIEVTGG